MDERRREKRPNSEERRRVRYREQQRTFERPDMYERRRAIDRRNTMKRRSARNKKRKTIIVVCLVILALFLLIGGIAGSWLYDKYSLSDEEMSATEYYGISNDSDLVVILNTEIVGVNGMVDSGVTYLSYEFVIGTLNSRFYWDTNNNNLLYTLEDGTVTASLGDDFYTKGNDQTQAGYQIVKTIGNEVYVAAEYVEIFTDMTYETYEEPYRIVINNEWKTIETFTALKDTQVRYQAGVKSEIISYVEEGDTLIYMDESFDDWTKVCTMDGFIGYVQTKKISEVGSMTLSNDFEEQVYTNISVDYTVNMVWHQVTSSTVNDSVLSSIMDTSGVTTIAPTWFFVNSTDGDVTSLASETYVNYVHQLGMDVWAVLNDFDGEIGSYQETYDFLSSTEARTSVINTVIAEAIRTGIDGINVDIELVSSDAGVHFIQFIRELSVKCRQNNIVLSVANYTPQSFNQHYAYEEQGIVADYVVIMGYDEHYGGSPVAGSVSSASFVEEGIIEMLTMVSADKIISGIPFYTRLWQETDKTEAELAEDAGTDAEEYLTNVSSTAYGMEGAQSVVNSAGVTATWDEATMQYFATWTVDDITYKIWLEDLESIEVKVQLMQEYNLAGVAAWKLGLEDSDVWAVIQKYVN